MAKPRKLVREEESTTLLECPCGRTQTADLTRRSECGKAKCDVCIPWSEGVCIDCDDPDELDEMDF